MESSFSNKQRIIQTISNILWIMPLTRNISEDDKQHLLRITPQRSISKLYVIPAKMMKELKERTI